MRLTALTLRAVLVCFVAVSAIAQPYEAQLRDFEEFVARKMTANQIPGLSVAVMKDGFVWAKGFGLADVENKVPATAESSYRMASVTKPMTAVAILELVEQGKIDLDAEVQKYVPEFPRKDHPVTVRQLLGHLGGISHYRNYAAEGRIREPRNTREALAIFQDFDLVAEPGTSYRYSSYGYNLLGAVIEGASGKPYGEFMAAEVWRPMGMTNTRMDDPRAVIPNRVRGYEVAGGKLRHSEYVDISSRFAAGGTRSTVVDMIKFVQGIDKVLTRETVELMWTGLTTRGGTATRYGLGWSVTPAGGRFRAAHGGSQQETRTELLYLPRQKFAVALATNLEGANLSIFLDRLALLFLGDSWNAGFFLPDRAESAIATALGSAWNNGLGYYDRYGKALSNDATELRAAFRYFNDAVKRDRLARIEGSDTILDRGRHPAAGQPFIKVGSYMARRLAASGADLERYHREGELVFFRDYIDLYRRDRSIPRQYRFDKPAEDLIRTWAADWSRVWTDDVKRLTASDLVDPAIADRLRSMFRGASITPDFSRGLVGASEAAAQQGNIERAMTLSAVALDLYPESEAANGLAGVFAVLQGRRDSARTLLDKSAKLNPRGYTARQNLTPIVDFLTGTNPDAARALAEEFARLHPQAAEPKKPAGDADDAAIVEVVDRAYVHGVHIDGDAEKMRSGMHESFVMFVRTNTGVNQVTREAWIERLTKSNPRAASAARPQTTARIVILDRSGDSAVVKVDLFRDGKQIFTDYISLYRFEDGWKLVGKTFQRHG
ncbi:MAG TPA: serine hydrolase [Thermoanaerobaculia bacterium]|nr:serine hydrolase [Thermoanaerobaculia bacterium]